MVELVPSSTTPKRVAELRTPPREALSLSLRPVLGLGLSLVLGLSLGLGLGLGDQSSAQATQCPGAGDLNLGELRRRRPRDRTDRGRPPGELQQARKLSLAE